MRKGSFRSLPVKLEVEVTDMFSFEVNAKIKVSVAGEPVKGNMEDISQVLHSDEFHQAISQTSNEIATLLASDQSCHAKITLGSGKSQEVFEVSISHEDKKDEFSVVK